MPSRWSLWSEDSVLCIGCRGSFLSVGSIGSVLSIGSLGSAVSVFSIGSTLAFASIMSARSAAFDHERGRKPRGDGSVPRVAARIGNRAAGDLTALDYASGMASHHWHHHSDPTRMRSFGCQQ